MIIEARGTCITLTPKKVAKKARLSTKPVMLTVVRYAIEEVLQQDEGEGVRREVRRRGSGCVYRYIVTCDSSLWQEAKGMTKEVMV